MAIRGRNNGRVGHIVSTERHPGSYDIVHVKDVLGHTVSHIRIINYCLLSFSTSSFFDT
jgi:small subunit ribosomal protein S4e